MSFSYACVKEEQDHYVQLKEEDDGTVWEDEQTFWELHLCYWEGTQSEEWARHVCRKRGVDTNEVDLRGFRVKDGISLQESSRQDFCYIVGEQYGAMFWKELQSYRAMQKQRCSRCVGSDNLSTLAYISSDKHSVQETPSDLSYNSLSRQNTPSPRFNPEDSIPYPDQPFRRAFAYSKYQEGRSSPGSLSPNYQEQNIYPEVPSQRLGINGETHQQPQVICLEKNNRKVSIRHDLPLRPLKPLPALISLDELESGSYPREIDKAHYSDNEKCLNSPQVLCEKEAPPVKIYTSLYPAYSSHSNPPAEIIRISHHQSPHTHDVSGRFHVHDLNGQIHTRVIKHTHDSYRKYSNQMYVQPQQNGGYHYSNRPFNNASRNSSDSDEEENEPGRLVIDIPEETLEEQEMEVGDSRLPFVEVGDSRLPFIEVGDSRLPFEVNKTVPHLQKIPTKRKRDRGPKSWEFLMRLLACPKTNPSIIRWENEAEGSFRLVQPQEIANMWGTRSNKDDLSYNNFARALRYHYKTKLLYKISERQLVYGCGEAALAFYRQLLKEQNPSLDVSTG